MLKSFVNYEIYDVFYRERVTFLSVDVLMNASAMSYTTDDIVRGIKEKDEKVIHFLYKDNFKKIAQLVKMNNGTEDDACDVFQDAFMIVYDKLRNDSLVLNVSIGTYLYSVARFVWLKELKRNKNNSPIKEEDFRELQDDDIHSIFIYNEKHDLVWQHFEKLSKDCQKVIQLVLDGKSISEVTGIMNYSSEQHTKNRRLRCKDSLIKRVIKDSRYNELGNLKILQEQTARW